MRTCRRNPLQPRTAKEWMIWNTPPTSIAAPSRITPAKVTATTSIQAKMPSAINSTPRTTNHPQRCAAPAGPDGLRLLLVMDMDWVSSLFGGRVEPGLVDDDFLQGILKTGRRQLERALEGEVEAMDQRQHERDRSREGRGEHDLRADILDAETQQEADQDHAKADQQGPHQARNVQRHLEQPGFAPLMRAGELRHHLAPGRIVHRLARVRAGDPMP